MGLIHSRASKKNARAQAALTRQEAKLIKDQRRALRHPEPVTAPVAVAPQALGSSFLDRLAASTERMEVSTAARRQRVAAKKAAKRASPEGDTS